MEEAGAGLEVPPVLQPEVPCVENPQVHLPAVSSELLEEEHFGAGAVVGVQGGHSEAVGEIYLGFALIGPAPTLLRSHWSRAS